MDENSIINSLKKWEEIRQKSQELISYLSQGNCFKFTNHQHSEASKYRHAYLGIHDGKLKLFVIPSAYDSKATKDIASYIEVCEVFPDPMPLYDPMTHHDRISDATAVRRVDRWDKDYTKWIPKKVATTEGVFKAFAIPTQDFETPEVKVRFALQDDLGQPMGYNADMIVACKEGKTIYEDYAEPVPPFTSNITKASFYLLSQV